MWLWNSSSTHVCIIAAKGCRDWRRCAWPHPSSSPTLLYLACGPDFPTSPKSSARWPSPTLARFTHLIWSYPSSDNDRALAVPQLGPLLQHWALAGIGDGWWRGGAQPDCPSDGLVPGIVAGEGLGGAEGCSLIGFTVIQWTMEQVEAERGTTGRTRGVCGMDAVQRDGV